MGSSESIEKNTSLQSPFGGGWIASKDTSELAPTRPKKSQNKQNLNMIYCEIILPCPFDSNHTSYYYIIHSCNLSAHPAIIQMYRGTSLESVLSVHFKLMRQSLQEPLYRPSLSRIPRFLQGSMSKNFLNSFFSVFPTPLPRRQMV
jgi:hypothetical protein